MSSVVGCSSLPVTSVHFLARDAVDVLNHRWLAQGLIEPLCSYQQNNGWEPNPDEYAAEAIGGCHPYMTSPPDGTLLVLVDPVELLPSDGE